MTRTRLASAHLLLAALAGLALSGCPADTTAKPQVVTSPCTANERACVDDRVVRVCPADGLGFVNVPCRSTETCTDGACVSVIGATACPAGANQCLSDRLVRSCSPDGTAWYPLACQPGEKCASGTCQWDLTQPCDPYTGGCLKGAPIVCKADGTGYASAACPAGTTCTGAGLCQGSACAVGTRCSSSGHLVACADGNSFTETACPGTQTCVDNDPFHGAAACKENRCTAGARACGNKLDAAADQTKYLSECLMTTEGYRWVATRCEGVLTCNPSGVACSTACRPGQTQCTSSPAGISTCAADGKWGAPAACGPGQVCGANGFTGAPLCADLGCQSGQKGVCTGAGTVRLCTAGVLGTEQALACATGACSFGECLPSCVDGETQCLTLPNGDRGVATCAQRRWPQSLSQTCSSPTAGASRACVALTATAAVCADPQCASGQQGVCTPDGKIRPCSGGQLAATTAAVNCPAGQICNASGCTPGGCLAGETACAVGGSYRTCQGGTFAAALSFCPPDLDAGAGLLGCIDTRNASNLRTAVCGFACTPTARKCAAPPDGGVVAELRVCDATGQWGAQTACAVGRCNGVEPSAGCQTECVPGQIRCAGADVSQPDMNLVVSAGTQACGAAGMWETTTTTCSTGTTCRRSATGTTLGCVACVGSTNEANVVDVRCGAANPDGGSDTVQVCGTNNEWPVAASFCNGLCTAAAGGFPAYCPATGGFACETCAQTTCRSARAACLADPACSVLENCLVTNGCYGPGVSMYNCAHDTSNGGCGSFTSFSAAATNYDTCLNHNTGPTGCTSSTLCY